MRGQGDQGGEDGDEAGDVHAQEGELDDGEEGFGDGVDEECDDEDGEVQHGAVPALRVVVGVVEDEQALDQRACQVAAGC